MSRHPALLVALGMTLLPALLSGCVTRGGRVSADAAPLARLHRAVVAAASDPHTWAPLAAAGVIWAAGVDEDIADWAREHKLLTNVTGVSDQWSDVTNGFTGFAAVVASGLPAAAGGGPDDPWLRNHRVATTGLGIAVATSSVQWVKPAIGRERPTGGKQNAFPSGHMALAGAANAHWRRNVAWLPWPRARRQWLQAGLTGLIALNAWDRIEKGRHFPTDVLAGYAYGNFLGTVTHELMLGGWRPPSLHLGALPQDGGARFELGVSGDL